MLEEETVVLRHLKLARIDYGKSIALSTGIDLQQILVLLEKLEEQGLIERVQGDSIKRENAKFKLSREVHKHHLYYRLTRKGKFLLRESKAH
ncbi:MAG: DUF2250 domain-containing protein [Thaumarchaeota archaeon]|nr:DUF2250 domain-containing protein [Nitrososphaerota archaeon]